MVIETEMEKYLLKQTIGCGLFYGDSEGNSSEYIADYVVGRVTIPTLE